METATRAGARPASDLLRHAIATLVTVTAAQVLALLVLLVVLGLASPRTVHGPAYASAAALAVGWVQMTSGTGRPSLAVAALRRPDRGVRAAIVGAAGMTTTTATVVVHRGGGPWLTALAVVAVTQVAVVTLARAVREPDEPAYRPPPCGPMALPNALILVFLLTSGTATVARLPDVYPVSRYPMFSQMRLDPYVAERVRFVGVDEAGRERRLRPPAKKERLLELIHDGDLATLRALAEGVSRGPAVRRVVVLREEIRVPPHPAPPGVEVLAVHEVVAVAVE